MEEDGSLLVLGKSLAVPSVQELAKEHTSTVPPRYIKEDDQKDVPPTAAIADAAVLSIPVIDLQILLHGGEGGGGGDSSLELQKFHSACKEWGFFQLVNHGIKTSTIDNMKSEVQDFFNLPFEDKQQMRQLPGDVEGYGQAFVVSEEQKLDWGDMFFFVSLPIQQRKPHIFRKLHTSFRDAINTYAVELRELAMIILGLVAKCLGMRSEEMKELFGGGFQSMRMNYYPPCPKPDLVMGLTPHSDAVALTLLLQVNEMEGLQVRKEGLWVPVKPLPNAFVVNIGDCLEIVSNGVYRSIEHRAVVNSKQERLSIATFYGPDLTGELGPALSLINQRNPSLFKRVGVEQYFHDLFNRKLQGKKFLDSYRA